MRKSRLPAVRNTSSWCNYPTSTLWSEGRQRVNSACKYNRCWGFHRFPKPVDTTLSLCFRRVCSYTQLVTTSQNLHDPSRARSGLSWLTQQEPPSATETARPTGWKDRGRLLQVCLSFKVLDDHLLYSFAHIFNVILFALLSSECVWARVCMSICVGFFSWNYFET